MGMAFLQRHGHTPVALVGGATGLIGDPSGRDSERELLTEEKARENGKKIKSQLEHFLTFEGKNAARMTNNLNWFGTMGYIECLREIGKHFSVNAMIAKESVRRRLQDREHGISYTEFSYQILQAYDFCYLYEHENCELQAGGSDQWGNITAGIDLIRRFHRKEAFGLTFPLVTTSAGEKFGKSAGNAVWLDPAMTSPYQFYQYWIRIDDRDVEKMLKFFTFVHPDEIENIMQEHERAPHKREAQQILAAEVTRTVHGQSELDKVIKASQVLFGGEIDGLNDAELLDIFNDVPSTEFGKERLNSGIPYIDILVETSMCKSKGEARRLIRGGGGYINNQGISTEDTMITTDHLASETVMILRTGKKKYHLIRFV
jgi:tyrosyl-tRNA synthetase